MYNVEELYGDLENFDFSTKLTELLADKNTLNEKLIAANENIIKYQEENKELQRKLECLERNTTSLYKTAASEIERKRKEIETLRITADESIKKDVEIKKLRSRINFLLSEEKKKITKEVRLSPKQRYYDKYLGEKHNEGAEKRYFRSGSKYEYERDINVSKSGSHGRENNNYYCNQRKNDRHSYR